MMSTPSGPIGAALIAAFFGWLSLIIARSFKLSELRQEWINSFRIALSDFISAVDVISGRIGIRHRHRNANSPLDKNEKKMLETELTEYWEKLRRSHALVLLHMKNAPSNTELIENKIEKKMEEILDKIKHDYQDINNEEVLNLRNDLLSFGRTLLKDEWDQIKKGEPAYTLALQTSFALLLVAVLSVLVVFFLPIIRSFL